MKTLLKLAVFSIAGIAIAQPIARPTYPAYAYPTNNGISTIYHQNKNTILSPPEVRSIMTTGGSNYIVLVRQDIPNAYHTSLINLGQYLNYFRYYKNDPNPKLVVYIAGGQGGWHPLPGTAATVVGGTGGITIFTAPLANFIKKFGPTVSFYYVVGGKGGTYGWAAGGGGASMVAVNNWSHNKGGIALAIAGGGGGALISGNSIYDANGGGGGGGNDCGQTNEETNGLYVYGQPVVIGQGGCQGKGGNSGNAQGGSSNPNLIDIAGGGGASYAGGTGGIPCSNSYCPAPTWCSGPGGGTGSPGQYCPGYNAPGYSGEGGFGYQIGGSAYTTPNSWGSNDNYSGGFYEGGYGGGGGSSIGSDPAGGGGYGGGGAGWVGPAGGGGGYCLDANHSPANNPSLGAELGSSCQAIDWKHPYDGVYGNYGNGYVYIYIEP